MSVVVNHCKPMNPSISKIQLNRHSRSVPLRRGFTLVEVLVVISIIAVLAVIAISTTRHIRRAASSAVCVSKMSQIGSAILIYSQEHGGRLPTSAAYGAPFVGQGPWYNRDDRRFQNIIGEYLGCAESTTWSTSAKLMTYDATFAWPALLSEGQEGAPSVLLNSSVKLLVNGTSSTGSPWAGSRSAPGSAYVGRMLDQIDEPGKQAAFGEVDQKNTNAGWKNLLPPEPVHGSYRNTLFFDWHVDRVAVKP